MSDKEHNFDESGRFAKGNQAHRRRKNPGRKAKMPRFVEAFKSVIESPHPVGNAVMFTDTELIRMTNRELSEEDRVPESRFSEYKNGNNRVDKELMEQFQEVYARALEEQKRELFSRMMDEGEKRSWQRYMAIIERRFDDWNLRQKQVDETPNVKKLVMRVADE